jgi:heme exporter protein D
MSSCTLFLSRLLGLYFLICGLAMIIHKQVFTDALATVPGNPLAMFWSALIISLAGLAMVLVHNVWSKRPVVVIVTLLGWLTLIKGILYLLLPAKWLEGFFQAVLNCGACLYSATAFMLLLGAYLTYGGFKSKPA